MTIFQNRLLYLKTEISEEITHVFLEGNNYLIWLASLHLKILVVKVLLNLPCSKFLNNLQIILFYYYLILVYVNVMPVREKGDGLTKRWRGGEGWLQSCLV